MCKIYNKVVVDAGYIEKGKAFRNLRGDGAYKTRLYHALGYNTFEECCEEETENTKRRVNELIGGSRARGSGGHARARGRLPGLPTLPAQPDTRTNGPRWAVGGGKGFRD